MSNSKSVIHVIGTGGTIAGIGTDNLDYTQYAELGNKLSIEQSLARIPEISSISNITSENG